MNGLVALSRKRNVDFITGNFVVVLVVNGPFRVNVSVYQPTQVGDFGVNRSERNCICSGFKWAVALKSQQIKLFTKEHDILSTLVHM